MPRVRPLACVVQRYHWPKPVQLDRHHVWPRMMGGPDTAANLIDACPNCHTSIHAALRDLIDGVPPRGSRAQRAVAERGYQQWVAAGKPGRPE